LECYEELKILLEKSENFWADKNAREEVEGGAKNYWS